MIKSEKLEAQESILDTLKKEGMLSFDVKLTPEEKVCIHDVRIEHNVSDLNHYGNIDEVLVKNLRTYLNQLGANAEEVTKTIAELITRLAEVMLKTFNKSSVWLAVRTSLPNTDWDVPRWHRDGGFLNDDNGNLVTEEFKLVFTLKGAPTRFAEVIDIQKFEEYEREEILNNEHDGLEGYEERALAIRRKLEETVREIPVGKKGFATIYRVDGTHGKIHSEPEITEPRIFISIITGSQSQIEELQRRFSSY